MSDDMDASQEEAAKGVARRLAGKTIAEGRCLVEGSQLSVRFHALDEPVTADYVVGRITAIYADDGTVISAEVG